MSVLEDKAAAEMPVVFLGHGSPMNIIDDNIFTQTFKKLGGTLPKPKAILAISAHWQTRGTLVQTSEAPKTIYDFGGFPEELYKIKYEVKGMPDLAHRISTQVPQILAQDEWGIDHGTWSVLVHMFPQHDVPVLQMSMNRSLSLQEHFELGKELQFLRKQGVLILGSGNIVHNLQQIKWDPNSAPFDWTLEFDSKVRTLVENKEFGRIFELVKNEPKLFNVAHPSYEHFIPLMYVLGAAGDPKVVSTLSSGTQNGSISMTSFQLG